MTCGDIVGAGFLVGSRGILTCAHVVTRRLAISTASPGPARVVAERLAAVHVFGRAWGWPRRGSASAGPPPSSGQPVPAPSRSCCSTRGSSTLARTPTSNTRSLRFFDVRAIVPRPLRLDVEHTTLARTRLVAHEVDHLHGACTPIAWSLASAHPGRGVPRHGHCLDVLTARDCLGSANTAGQRLRPRCRSTPALHPRRAPLPSPRMRRPRPVGSERRRLRLEAGDVDNEDGRPGGDHHPAGDDRYRTNHDKGWNHQAE